MEEILMLLAFVALIAFIAFPIIILAKLSNIGRSLDYLKNEIGELNKKFGNTLHNTISKEDTEEILIALNELKGKASVVAIVEDIEPVKEFPTPKSTIIEEAKEIIEEKPIEGIETPLIETKKDIIHETEETSVVLEEKEEEIHPPIAAFARPERVEHIVVETPPSVKRTEPARKDVPEKNIIEQILGDNWLTKVGIITLVLGIAFFVKYAIDQEWINEIGRVAIGMFTGGIIVGIAHKLKSKYHVFSSILVGGGISVFYITITLAFREYEIFGQTLAFILLIAITIFSVILSLLYDRKELAIFSLLGGFASPLMISTGTGNYIVLFSYILILNSGMLLVSFWKKWRVIGIISYILSLIFFWAWLFSSFKSQYIEVTIFAILFFVQFYLLALIDHFKSERKVSAYQAFLILTNNASLFFACLYIFGDYAYDVRGIVTISIAVINAVIMFTLFRKSDVDRNLIYLIIAVVMTFVSLAIPIQLHGHVITMFWAAEAVILLWLWQRSHINVFRIGHLLICLLIVISFVMDVDLNYMYAESLSVAINRMFVTGLVVIASFVISMYMLRKEDVDSQIEIRGFHLASVSTVIKVIKILVIAFTFIVPFLEINYQLERFTDTEITSSFRYLALATYASIYIAVVALIYRKKIGSETFIFILLSLAVAGYASGYAYLAVNLRFDIFFVGEYASSYFLIHLLSLPAVAFVIYLLTKNIKSISKDNFSLFCWSMVVMSVIILSVEIDNIVILMFGNADNYDKLLYDVHTFGYPILWGICAMILMIWGLKQKEVLLRKISLIFFGLVIVKFYAYDVWHMSQTGRIVSFILLGVILLLVSFLQQKIKTLVKEDDTQKEHIKEENK